MRAASSCVGCRAELGVIDDRGQDVVELVGDAAGQGADAAELLGLKQLLAELVGLGTGNHHVLADHVSRLLAPDGRLPGGLDLPGSAVVRTKETRLFSTEPAGVTPYDLRLSTKRYRLSRSNHFIQSHCLSCR